jgi:hypothetical protein
MASTAQRPDCRGAAPPSGISRRRRPRLPNRGHDGVLEPWDIFVAAPGDVAVGGFPIDSDGERGD